MFDLCNKIGNNNNIKNKTKIESNNKIICKFIYYIPGVCLEQSLVLLLISIIY